MYTLRKVCSTGAELNYYLGKSYTFIEKDKSPKEFEAKIRNMPLNEEEKNNLYGFVFDRDGDPILEDTGIALYKGDQHYIMTEGGKTFDNLTRI